MRFTLTSLGDVDVPDGSTVTACRAGLVSLTGIAAFGTAPLGVDGYLLEDGQVAGAEPWVPGSTMSVGAPSGPPVPDAARAALDSPWHLAVLSGPDAGLLAVPGADGSVLVGRGGTSAAPRRGPGALVLADPAVSVRQARVRRAGRRWVVHDLGSANGTRVEPAGTRRWRPTAARPRRAGRRRGRRLATGQEVLVGSTVLVVRRLVEGDRGAGAGRDVPASRRPRGNAATWAVPAAVSLALAVLLHSVVPLLFTLTALGPVLAGLRTGRRPARRGGAQPWPDPAASAVRGADCGGARADVHTTRRDGAAPRAGPAAEPWWAALEDAVAITGARKDALALARALVGAAIAEPDVSLAFALGPEQEGDWSWCRWVEHRSSGAGARALLVADGADRSTLDRWSLARPPGAGVLLVMGEDAVVPAWCGWTIDGAGRVHRRGAERDGAGADGSLAPAVGPGWADTHSRRVAARDRRLRHDATGLPDRIGLVELGAPTDARTLAAHWSAQHGPMASLVARICVDAAGPAALDLLADGPHALIAGTTGAGKSALLQSLVLDLALRYPPDRLAIVLVDFKGGAGLGPCRHLPHVVGEVTDLDAVLAARAVDGLRRELGRRERLFREAGVADLEALRSLGPAPPRILVVVDELRALRDDLPDVLPALVRLAAQGRSLGIHLVLATQRPAGAVDAQVRANVALRICLRVTDPADSLDVVGVPDAAGLPAHLPGRAVVRRGDAAPIVEQTAWAALGPSVTAARWARPWPTARDGIGGPGAGPAAPRPSADLIAGLVDAARCAADGRAAPTPLWSPPLPPWVDDTDVAKAAEGAARGEGGSGLALGLTDRPELQAVVPARWEPASGALLVIGRPGSGRTTALRAVARSALRVGLTVHRVLGRPPTTDDAGGGWACPRPCSGAWGTFVDVADPRRIHRLIHLLRTEAERGGVERGGIERGGIEHLLLVDDVGGVLRVLEAGRHTPGAEALTDLLRDAPRLGIGVAVAGSPAEILRLVPQASTRLVLATSDSQDDAALGVPRDAPGRAVPGRGVLLPGARTVQVSAGDDRDRRDAAASTVDDTAGGLWARAAADGSPARTVRRGRLRLDPIPLAVELDAAELADHPLRTAPRSPGRPGLGSEAGGRPRVTLGRGGDDAGLVTVSLAQGLLVLGPPGSGRSTALSTIRAGVAAQGGAIDAATATATATATAAAAAAVTGAGPVTRTRMHRDVLDVTDLLPGRAARPVTPESRPDLASLLRAWWSARADDLAEPVVLVDDLDRLLRSMPAVDELLAGWIDAHEDGRRAPLVVVALRSDSAAACYRGAVAALRRAAPVLVLAPSTTGSAEAAGGPVMGAADPAFPRHPGRGVVLHAGTAVPLQVGRPVWRPQQPR